MNSAAVRQLNTPAGRRPAGVFSCLTAAVCMSLAGYLHSAFVAGVSMFYVMLLLQSFFGSGNYSIVGPYMGELWPGRLRGSGMGFVYGIGTSASSSARRVWR